MTLRSSERLSGTIGTRSGWGRTTALKTRSLPLSISRVRALGNPQSLLVMLVPAIALARTGDRAFASTVGG
ncbi:hypothetical protein PN498_13405 [Oscillatoria sp. CS-180]|uniref:hypothetical protein n=1 Tax=Oscillatoria sp. CS-180 TaxID=3021720 RepID=UPI00232B4C6E|nr:hypothetical protein [Oscillatoria sp. CS-180]MDB9526991.1 hypothetical protein [Oscillatoria sp. CS-180]